MALLAFRHGLRAAEVVDLRRERLKGASLHVRRVKNGTPDNASVDRSELRTPAGKRSVALCVVSERGAPRTAPGFSRMIERAGIAADLGIKVHAHMLPHACGYKLAGDGVDAGPASVPRPPQ